MQPEEHTPHRKFEEKSGRVPPKADEKSSGQAGFEFNEDQPSFFHAIERFSILKSFQRDLHLLTGLPLDFVDLSLRSSDMLSGFRLFTPFCTLINSTPLGRLACQRDDHQKAAACLKGNICLARRCHLGLVDITKPIVINGNTIGLLCTGQLLYQRPTTQAFKRIEKRLASLGVDLVKARHAYFNLPVLEKQRVTAIIDLMQMVAELIGNQKTRMLTEVVSPHPLARVLNFIEAHYAEPLTLPAVAKVADLSVSRLAHVFKAEIGMSVMAYLNTVRVKRVEFYLTNSQLRVSEIAFQVGFGNLSHFNHVFHKATGLSPSKYRQQTSTKK